MGFGDWKHFNNCALRMVENENAYYIREDRTKRVTYKDCVKVLLKHLYYHNKMQFTAAGVSRFHRNLLAYSFLTTSQKIGAMFRNFNVCGKTHQEENEALAKWGGYKLETAMEYLCRHYEEVDDLKIMAEDHPLFMCLDDLTKMYEKIIVSWERGECPKEFYHQMYWPTE